MKVILELKEMPNNCAECDLSICNRPYVFTYCQVTKDDCNKPYAKRNNNCPLKEVE